MNGNARVGLRTKVWHPELSVLLECEIGDDCVVHAMVWIGYGVKIGNRVKIQAQCFIPEGVTIEDDCFIGPKVCFTNDPNLEIKGKDCWKPTLIKRGAKIGAGAIIKAGITIGEGAKIGMGAVVTKNVPAGEIWVGNPAKPIKKITPDMMDPYHPDVNEKGEILHPVFTDPNY